MAGQEVEKENALLSRLSSPLILTGFLGHGMVPFTFRVSLPLQLILFGKLSQTHLEVCLIDLLGGYYKSCQVDSED